MPYVHKSALFNTVEEAEEHASKTHFDKDVVEVKIVAGPNLTEAETAAMQELADYATDLFIDRMGKTKRFPWRKQDGQLNEGGRLLLAALRDARAEACAAAQKNHDVDVLNGESPEQFAVYYLMSVIDWCDENWLKAGMGQTTNPMRKYFTLASMFRRGKWQARATWPDQPNLEQHDIQFADEGEW